MAPQKKKRAQRKYDKAVMEKAVNDILNGMKYREAEEKYDIPRSTICDAVQIQRKERNKKKLPETNEHTGGVLEPFRISINTSETVSVSNVYHDAEESEQSHSGRAANEVLHDALATEREPAASDSDPLDSFDLEIADDFDKLYEVVQSLYQAGDAGEEMINLEDYQ